MSTTNLPSWPGASAAYSKAYALLQVEAEAAWSMHGKRWHLYWPTEDARALIKALDKGDEETIKWYNLEGLHDDSRGGNRQ